MSTLAIRPAETSELAAIQALLEASALPAADLAPTHLPNFLVLDGDAGLLGCVALEIYGPDALLRSLAVAPPARQGGQGRALVDAIEAKARAIGIEHLYLLTTTADVFFATLGYTSIERASAPATLQGSSQFAGLCPASSVCMSKNLKGKA